MNELNFNRNEKIVVKALQSTNWNKVSLNTPLTIKEINGVQVADVYKIGDVFYGILSNKDKINDFVEIEPIKAGYVYTVYCKTGVAGSFIQPGEDGFIEAITGPLQIVKRLSDLFVVAVGIGSNGSDADCDIEGATVNDTSVEIKDKILNIKVDKETVGLNNVDNTSDANKPVSTATDEAIKKSITDFSNIDGIKYMTSTEYEKLSEDEKGKSILYIIKD